MPMKIYLDDLRPAPSGRVRVFWPNEAIALLKPGEVTHLSLDHGPSCLGSTAISALTQTNSPPVLTGVLEEENEMARHAFSEDEIRWVYEHLKSNLPRIPDPLLREISGNDSIDTRQDVDPNDIIRTLSAPGPIAVFSSEIASECTPEAVMADLVAKAAASAIDLSTVSGAFLIVKSCKWRMVDFGCFRNLLNDRLHPFANFVSTWYHDRRVAESESVQLILSGISTLEKFEFVGPEENLRGYLEHTRGVSMDIPAFLRNSVKPKGVGRITQESTRWLNIWMTFWLYLVQKFRK